MCDRSHDGHRGDDDCAGPTASAFDRRSRPLSLTQIGEIHVQGRWRLLCGSYGRVHSRADQRLSRSRKSQNSILSALQLVLCSFTTSSSFSPFPRHFSILKFCFFCKICDITYCQCYLQYCEKDHEAFFQQMQQSIFLHKLQN